MVSTVDRRRARADLARVVHRGLGVRELAPAATRVLGRVVPYDGTCLLTMDPATLLPTGEVVEDGLPPSAAPCLTRFELLEPDFNKFTALARAEQPAASLSQATEGDLDLSLRQRELRRPSGFEDELRVALRDGSGTWGALTFLRGAGRPHFTSAEVAFVASVAEALADGVRRATLLDGVMGTGHDAETGLLVLTAGATVEMANEAAERWLDELGGGDRPDGQLPVVVRAVAARARRAVASGETDDGGAPEPGTERALAGRGAWARVRTSAGRWVIARGSILGEGAEARVAVLLEPAHPAELAPLIADAYGLTARERRITELVAQGLSTNEIADRLHLSAYTVQDHLKSVFEKSGTGTRGELVARLFFEHYAPHLAGPAGA